MGAYDETTQLASGQLVTTLFAPAERAHPDTIAQQAVRISSLSPWQRAILDAVPGLVLVLNPQRQIVFANQSTRTLTGLQERALLGLRPGEALGCIHAFETQGGCGTTRFCSTCGAVRAILTSQRGRADVQECRVVRAETSEALDLRVWATPLDLGDESFTIFSVLDIGDEKRRRALERIFFHDILNTASAVSASAQIILHAPASMPPEIPAMLGRLSDRLIQEIASQRELLDAENSELALTLSQIDIPALLDSLGQSAAQRSFAEDRCIRVVPPEVSLSLVSDITLLRRVLDNMLKNALEATQAGDSVTLGARPHEIGVEFWVHNPGYMQREVQYQVFQRSFSTKGTGRGLGTYSMKLLSERYLKGQVTFDSSPERGTTFRAIYPLATA